jgi:hypothetical protein
VDIATAAVRTVNMAMSTTMTTSMGMTMNHRMLTVTVTPTV